MLDQIRKMIAEVLEVSSADIIKTRTALLTEQATEDARYAATSALNHPEGSTTPIEEAYSRAQDRVARIRKQVEKELPKVMSLMMAMEIAEQRRAEAKLHREQIWSRPASEEDLNLNRAAVNWFPRLRRHGVHPHYLKQHSNETVAIISDLIIWKAKDATFQDPRNPWRQVLGIYAGRKISKPTKKGRSGGSVPGKPTPDRHKIGSGDYRFDEMISASWGVATKEVEATNDQPSEARGMPTIDCSIYPEDLTPGAMDSVVETEPDKTEDESAPEPETIDHSMIRDFAEYALPSHIDAEGVTKLRKAAEPLADDEGFDESLFHLRWAMNDKVDALSVDQAIALVEGKQAPSHCTPFEYFLEGARRGGKAAGLNAYREATIRRIMLMIATDPTLGDARKRLGLAD